VYLKEIARVYNLRLRKKRDQGLSLSSRWSTLLFRENSRQLNFNGVTLWMNAPLYRAGWRYALDYADACWTVDPLLRRHAHLQRLQCRRVVLDPGHGGRDRGARGRRGVEEKVLVLDIARRVRFHVAHAGIKVYLTRQSDRYLSLDERVKRAARWNADLFVSIHANAALGRRGRGVETYVLAIPGFPSTNAGRRRRRGYSAYRGNAWNGANLVLAYFIQKALLDYTRAPDRGIRRCRFHVLKEAPCPAVLVECGFLSNTYEEQKLLAAPYREKLARGIASGILQYADAVRDASRGVGPVSR
ncbi:MAG TPA: N-acetylmuramoyl-L-alanine amidase, partial [Kiritimatiellae bacterium]|nr:N-acetylmuramoyl-L-alanine amidase [Kiritimatiellia bacterium]